MSFSGVSPSRLTQDRVNRGLTLTPVPKPPLRPEALARRIFRGADALESGLLTRAQLRSSAWRPLFRGVYADRDLTITHRLRCLAVSDFLLPEDGVVAGRSAASLYGAPYGADEAVEILTPGRFGPMAGILVHRGPVPEKDVTRRVDGIRVTTPQRTGWDLARWLDVVEATALLDVMVAKGAVSVGALTEYAQARIGKPGWGRLLKAAQLVDPAARGLHESRVRVRLVLAGVAAPVVKYVLARDGQPAVRLDLAWPEHRVAVDCAEIPAPPLDADWLVLPAGPQHLADGFDTLVRDLKAALRARRPRS